MWYCDRQLHADFQPISVDQLLGRNFRFWAAGMSASMTGVVEVSRTPAHPRTGHLRWPASENLHHPGALA